MKKFFAILTMVVTAIATYSQAPQKLSYQAVIRNSSGQLVTSHAVGIKLTILQGSPSGSVVYQENFNSLSNANGLVSIEIGGGAPVSGTFTAINWASGSYYLRTETDPSGGTSYTISGTSQLLSVPYALHAKNAASYTETDPVFGASASKGITSGNIINWNTSYGWGNHAGLYKPISYVPAWNEITGKPTSVGGYGITDAVTLTGNQIISGIKTFNNDLMVNGLTIGKGKNTIVSNSAFGLQALNSNTTGDGNTAFGCKALYSNSTGEFNTASGDSALYSNSEGYRNTAFGAKALYKNSIGIRNTAIGSNSLENNTSGDFNTAIGWYALLQNTEGKLNTACGVSLVDNTTGDLNTAAGFNALSFNKTGGNNTAVGSYAGYNSLASGNVFLGYQAGYYETGSNKLFIDNQQRTGQTDARIKALIYGVFDASPANQSLTINGNTTISGNATVTGNLQIGGSYGPITSNWWEFGTDSNNGTGIDFHSNTSPTDYSARIFRTPGNDGEFQVVNNGSGPLVLYTSGGLRIVGLTSSAAGAPLIISSGNVYFLGSTRDIKDNIQPLDDDFSKILNTSPVSFTDKNTGMKGIGYIAEEFEDAGLQNLLVYENGKLVSLRYDLISVYNLEIIKELQKHLESVEEENHILRDELDELKADMNNLKRKLRK